MKKWGSTGANLSSLAFLLLLIIVWELTGRAMHIPEYIVPAPSSILKVLLNNMPLLWLHTKTTFYAASMGLVIAVIFAIVLSAFMDKVKIIKKTIYPLLVISQTIPIIALAPIMIIWFGFGILPKVLVVVLVCFFPLAVNLIDGLENVDQELVELLQVMKAGPWRIFKSVQMPSVLPYFFSGLKIAATYSVMGAVIAEWLGASAGLGIYMTRAMHSFSTSSFFAAILIVVVLSMGLFKLTELLAWLFMPWNRVKEE